MNNKEIETPIDRHFIGGHGTLLQFVFSSKNLGTYDLDDSDIIKYLEQAASIEDKESRDIVVSMVKKLQRMSESNAELRKCFETTHTALVKINATLKERAEADTA